MTLCDLTSSRAELAAVCAAGRAWGGPPAVLDVLERAIAAIDRDVAERVASLEADAARKRDARSRPPPVRGQSADARQLSLSDLDLRKSQEREESRAREPSADEPALALGEPLTDARRAVAQRFGVADPDRCWAKFVGRNAGLPLAKVDARWLEWVARELPPKLAVAPASETRIRAGPRSHAEQRQLDEREQEYRRAAVPMPTSILAALRPPATIHPEPKTQSKGA